jgi:hypothetical protein
VLADPGNGGGSGGSPTVLVPSAPADGTPFKVKDTTNTANDSTQKIGINPGGVHIEDPQQPGSYVTTTVYIVQPSDCRGWNWDNTLSHWGLTS